MNTIVTIHEQREAEYKSATPIGHPPLAPIKGQYQITNVEIKDYKGRQVHLATATWRKGNRYPIVNTVNFRFYLECLFNAESNFPAQADIHEMTGKTINILSIISHKQSDKTIISAFWKFTDQTEQNILAKYTDGQALTDNELCTIIDQGWHLASEGIVDCDEAEYEYSDNEELDYTEPESLEEL